MRKAFTLIEMVFAVLIVGALASLAIGQFMLTRTDSAVAAFRNDASVATKSIVGKVFADNLITTTDKAPKPDDITKTPEISWSEWILEVGGLDKSRWVKPVASSPNADRGVSPAHTKNGVLLPCGSGAMIEILENGDLYFNPSAVAKDTSANSKEPEVCKKLRLSYESKTDLDNNGNKIFPLTTSQSLAY